MLTCIWNILFMKIHDEYFSIFTFSKLVNRVSSCHLLFNQELLFVLIDFLLFKTGMSLGQRSQLWNNMKFWFWKEFERVLERLAWIFRYAPQLRIRNIINSEMAQIIGRNGSIETSDCKKNQNHEISSTHFNYWLIVVWLTVSIE